MSNPGPKCPGRPAHPERGMPGARAADVPSADAGPGRCAVPVELTPTEFRLLRHLLRHAGEAVGRPQLLAAVWDYAYGDAVLDTAIWQLRRKVDTGGPRLVHTVRGYGYAVRES